MFDKTKHKTLLCKVSFKKCYRELKRAKKGAKNHR